MRARISYKPDGPTDSAPWRWGVHDADGTEVGYGFSHTRDDAEQDARAHAEWLNSPERRGGPEEWIEL